VWNILISIIKRIDWSLAILAGVFLAVAPLGTFFGSDARNLLGAIWQAVPETDSAAYANSITAAAVLHPKHAVTLATIDPSVTMVDVVTFSAHAPDGKRPVWVSLPHQLRAACAGAADPVRRLQQVLGLPRNEADDFKVFELRVPRDKVFRPCVGGGDLAQSLCSTGAPMPLPENASAEELRKGYDRMHFLASQLWTSRRLRFSAPGYPFTGMGWSYDWSGNGLSVGVTEFIVERGTAISDLRSKVPAEFCKPT
jgi:hypothetical protein